MRIQKQCPRIPVLLCGLAAGIALATPAQEQGQQQVPSTAVMQLQAGSTAPGVQQPALYRAVRFSELKGSEVRNTQGRKLGEIEDLVLNPLTGQVRYAIMSFDPGVFRAERTFLVPLDRLGTQGVQGSLVFMLDLTRDQLENASVNRSEWTASWLDLPATRERIERAWGQRRSQETAQSGGQVERQAANAGRLVRASELVGKSVQNPNGAAIGELEELVVDLPRDRVHYAVVSFDRGWLRSDKRTALPVNAMHRRGDSGELVLNVNQQQAKAMRDFQQGQYATLNDRSFVAEMDRYLATIPPALVSWQQPDRPAGSNGGASASIGSSSGYASGAKDDAQSSAAAVPPPATGPATVGNDAGQGSAVDTRTLGGAAGNAGDAPAWQRAPLQDRN